MKRVLKRLFRKRFPGSSNYWAARYRDGGTSGAGSYGRLADYKAKIINGLVDELNINSVVEFGSGDGNQASLFVFENYTGVDVADEVIITCNERFSDRKTWRFLSVEEDRAEARSYDLALSLDVIYHLIEDSVYEGYMRRLVDASGRYLLIYASDYDQINTGAAHVRHRSYSKWIADNEPSLKSVREWAHPYPMTANSDPDQTSFASFRLFKKDEQ